MKPNEQQALILEHEGSCVVIASPGSGKTFVLSQKIKLYLKSIQDHQGIIAISYTNKASNELKNRSLSHGENPKSSFFGTIDKFNLSEIVIPFGKHLFGIPENDIRISQISQLEDEEQVEFEWFNRDFRYDQLKRNHVKILSKYFLSGSILIETIGLFANYIFDNSIACKKYIKSRYTCIFIDEYQDSGFEQHHLFLKIMQLNITAIAVGDLNQSIYRFSGKDARFLKELTGHKSFKYFRLNKNHRCHSSIINYSNFLLNPKTELLPIEVQRMSYFNINGNEANIANWIDKSIDSLMRTYEVAERKEIAILTRGNRTGEILNHFLKIPHRLLVSNELDQSLNIWSAIFSNLLHFVFDKSFKFIEVIEVFTSYEKFSGRDLKRLKASKDKLETIISKDEETLKLLRTEFIKIAQIIAPNSYNAESIELLDIVLANAQALDSYSPTKGGEISILTLHKSKGLEYDLVFHVDLYEWVFPNKQPGPNGDFNKPVFGDWDQDLNLHYVGVTRARKGCVLISSSQRTNNNSEVRNGRESEFLNVDGISALRNNSLRV